MSERAEPTLLPTARRRVLDLGLYAGPRTQAAADWLEILEADHGGLARSGAALLLATVDTRRFQLSVTPGAPPLAVSFHAGGRRTLAAELRRDTGLVEFALPRLSEALDDHRAAACIASRLEALAPPWFRWTEGEGTLPGLELAACANEDTAAGVADLLDSILVQALRVAGSVQRSPKTP